MSANIQPLILIKEYQVGNEALNHQLEKLVEEQMAQKKNPDQHSNIGGWQSDRDLHVRLHEGTPSSDALLELFANFAAPIIDFINGCCAVWGTQPSPNYTWDYAGSWFNVAVPGGYNAPHTHPLSAVSGAYYIRTEEPPKEYPFSGRIDFYYPNGEQFFFPKPGTLILFPGNMLHFVHPYYGKEKRISLSFNVNKIRGAPAEPPK
jgi:hypothetical protein